jgi:hypothetical protein
MGYRFRILTAVEKMAKANEEALKAGRTNSSGPLARAIKANKNAGPSASAVISGGAMHDAVAKVASNVKPSPPGSISRVIKAVMQNKLGVDSTDGRTIRNDGATEAARLDTNQRRPVAFDVQEAVCQLTARKTRRNPTPEEIRAETAAPSRDADSVFAIMRANRKLQ